MKELDDQNLSQIIAEGLIGNDQPVHCVTPEKVVQDQRSDIASSFRIKDGSSILANFLSFPGISVTRQDPDTSTPEMVIGSQQFHLTHALAAAAIQTSPTTPIVPGPETAINPVECQVRLLKHIPKQHNMIMSRLRTICKLTLTDSGMLKLIQF